MLGQQLSPITDEGPQRRLNHATWLVCEAVGEIIEFWGFKRALGRTWTLMYLSAEPLSATDVGRDLGLSSGAVSMTLKEMEHWGIIQRVSRPGQRQYFYRAETRLWLMIARVVKNREIHQIERLIQALQAAIKTLEADRATPGAALALGRLKALLGLAELGAESFRILFQDKNLDLAALQKIAQIRQLFQKSEGD